MKEKRRQNDWCVEAHAPVWNVGPKNHLLLQFKNSKNTANIEESAIWWIERRKDGRQIVDQDTILRFHLAEKDKFAEKDVKKVLPGIKLF